VNTPAADEISRLFREVVLVLGGVFAVRGTDDETICQTARGLERAYLRAIRRRSAAAAGTPAGPPGAVPHPAIAGLLRLIDTEEGSR
jgi:hypothetical protein